MQPTRVIPSRWVESNTWKNIYYADSEHKGRVIICYQIKQTLRQSVSEILKPFDKGIINNDITIIHVNVANNRGSKYMKQKLTIKNQ